MIVIFTTVLLVCFIFLAFLMFFKRELAEKIILNFKFIITWHIVFFLYNLTFAVDYFMSGKYFFAALHLFFCFVFIGFIGATCFLEGRKKGMSEIHSGLIRELEETLRRMRL